MRATAATLLLSSALFACASPRAPSRAPATPPAANASPATEDTWSTLSWEDRHVQMTFLVLPVMARHWQAFEKTKYPELTCTRCHGKDAEARDYKMPSPDLAPLDARMQSAHAGDAKVERVAAFMRDEVMPSVIELLDADPAKVTCFTCHSRSTP
jgi:cytochrome c553